MQKDKPEPITVGEAAGRLGIPVPRLRVWMTRHRARRLGKVGKTVYYDFWDLSTIDAMKNLGVKVLPTPEARDEWRAKSREAARKAA